MNLHTPSFDSHVHVFPAGRHRGLMRWIHRIMPGHPVGEGITEAGVLQDLEGSGVAEFFNLVYPLGDGETAPLNEWCLSFAKRVPAARPVCSMHVETANKPAVAEDLFRRGSYGIKFHPFIQGFNPSDAVFDDLYRAMDETGMPLFLHTGFDAWYGSSFPASDIERIVRGNPGMPVVLVHMIFPDLAAAFGLLDNYGNVILDATNVPGAFVYARKHGMELPASLVDEFVDGVERHHGRVMYGSDHPVGMGSLADIRGDLDALGLSAEALASLRGVAARTLRDLTDERRRRLG